MINVMSKPVTLGQVSDFDIRLLRIFKTVVECGSFSAAESVLGISRSAISLHMGDLEKRLGVCLCRRGRAGFALTDEGREVLRAANILLSAIEDFRDEVNQLHRQLRGDLNIGIINNLVTQSHMHVTKALKALSARGPGVCINIAMMVPSDIEQGVLDGTLHVGVIPEIHPLPGLAYLRLYEEQSSLYCSSEHPFFLSPVPDDTAIRQAHAIFPNYRITDEAHRWLGQLHCTAKASDREGIAFLILSGHYIGFLPDHYAATWVARGQMRAIRPDEYRYSTPLSVVVRKGRRSNMVLDSFLGELGAPDTGREGS